MEIYNTGAACATLPNDWCNTDIDIVLYSSDDEEDDLYDDDVGASPTTRPGPVSPARAAAKSA